jgi:hypothetical protein
VIDWKQSLPQIIGALIGSSLLVAALSMINSYVLRPNVDISVDPYPKYNNETMTYTISFKNIGYAPATHLRLTMSYPGAKILHTIVDHEEENMTVKNESEGTSVVTFLPRLTPGASIAISNSITRSNPRPGGPFIDYTTDTSKYIFPHHTPYSIVATYDQGSNEPNLSEYPAFPPPFYPYNTEVFKSSILIVLAALIFAMVVRRKRRSKSKFASDILTDVMKVQNKLNENSQKNHKSVPNAVILHLHTWQSNIDERLFFDDYKDYQKIDDFYSVVRSRDHYLLQNQVSSDILSILNKDCVNKATVAYKEIDWTKFHNLDLVLLIPAIILGTLLMDAVSAGSVLLSLSVGVRLVLSELLLYMDLVGKIVTVTISFFIIRLILKATQGVIINIYGLPNIFRSYALLLYCFVIVGIIPNLVNFVVVDFIFNRPFPCIDCLVITSFMVDIGCMFLLTWVVWRHYMKHKIFLFLPYREIRMKQEDKRRKAGR